MEGALWPHQGTVIRTSTFALEKSSMLEQARNACAEQRKKQRSLQQERLQLTTAVQASGSHGSPWSDTLTFILQTYTTQLGELAGLSREVSDKGRTRTRAAFASRCDESVASSCKEKVPRLDAFRSRTKDRTKGEPV